MPKNQWDRYAKIFDEGIGNGDETLHRDFIDPLIFELLDKEKLGTVIDAGCGNGYLVNKLSLISKKVIGLDYSEELLAAAKVRTKGKNNVELLLADLTQIFPLEDASADVLVANMVLQYLPSLEVFSSESYRILKPGKILIVLVDHPGHQLFARAQELAGKTDPHFINHRSYFKKGLRKKNSLWGKAILEYYHRPIEGYVNPFANYFKLEVMRETTQNGESPRLLALKFRKPEGGS